MRGLAQEHQDSDGSAPHLRVLPSPAHGMVSEYPKSLSHKPPHDEDGGKVNEREVVLRFLLPADQQLPAAVEPPMPPLHDPTPRSGATPTGASLFAAPSDVRMVVPPAHRPLHDGVVISLV